MGEKGEWNEGRKEGISLKEIIEGWGQGASPFLNGLLPEGRLKSGGAGERERGKEEGK